jgi:hypothetical protein
MSVNPTMSFLKATSERAVGLAAGSLASFIIVNGGSSPDVGDIDWSKGLGIAGGAALLSVLASFVKSFVGPVGPGLTETVVVRDAGADTT